MDHVRILQGDCLTVLPTLEAESVHCCVTSPPYFGLRDYSTAMWEGGSAECEHLNRHGMQGADGDRAGRSFVGAQNYYRETCGLCGATLVDQQIGLEPTPEAFVAKLVSVFREVRRVLRADGTLWLNLGDSYAASGKNRTAAQASANSTLNGSKQTQGGVLRQQNKVVSGLKAKDLIGIPWMVAFALRADGWYLRQDIIWSKPNPMPESVTDRCTKAHEYIFLLSKSGRYYFDAEAIAEKAAYAGQGRGGSVNRYEQNAAGMDNKVYDTRNKRSVWTVKPASFDGVHFATFPPALIEPCILAGCPEGGTVLDPFGGSGTTGQVALAKGRKAVLIELNLEYIELIRRRTDDALCRGMGSLFAEVP